MSRTIQHPICARNGCPNKGIHLLTVFYINREGWFCEDCKLELVNAGLVFENENNSHWALNPTTGTDSSAGDSQEKPTI